MIVIVHFVNTAEITRVYDTTYVQNFFLLLFLPSFTLLTFYLLLLIDEQQVLAKLLWLILFLTTVILLYNDGAPSSHDYLTITFTYGRYYVSFAVTMGCSIENRTISFIPQLLFWPVRTAKNNLRTEACSRLSPNRRPMIEATNTTHVTHNNVWASFTSANWRSIITTATTVTTRRW